MKTGLIYITDIKGTILFVISAALYNEQIAKCVLDTYDLQAVFSFEYPEMIDTTDAPPTNN